MGDLLPETSSGRYKEFQNWMDSNGLTSITENNKFATLAPNSLFSMLKSCLLKERLGSFVQVQAYLNKSTKNYKPKRSFSFAAEEFHGFNMRAPDDRFLLHKVVLILDISGAVRGNEIFELKSCDVLDKGDYPSGSEGHQNMCGSKILRGEYRPLKICRCYI